MNILKAKSGLKMIRRYVPIFLVIVSLIFSYFPFGIREAEALDVANGDGLIIYGVSGNTTPQWRTYNGTANSFGAAGGTIAGATGLTFVVRTSPTKQEAIAGYVNSAGTLQVMCYNGASWTNEWTATVGGTGTTRRFDIAYETNSGDVMVLYSNNVATTNELNYRTKLGSTGCGSANWSAATNLNPANTSGIVHWVKMAWDKRSTSNLITAIWGDANADLGAMVWSGSAWGNEPSVSEISLEVVTAAQDVDDFDVEYESSSGDVMVVWANSAGANGTNGVRYRTCTGGTSACTWNAVTTPPTFADDATNLDISANPNSDEIVFASIGDAGSDLQVGYWSGSAWTNTANADISSATPLAGTRLVATGWLISGGTTRSIVAYNDSAATNIGWYVGNGSTFTKQTDFTPTPAFGNPQKWYSIDMDPINKDRLMFTLSDVNSDLFAKRLIMTATPAFTWTNADGGAALEANLAQATVGDFSLAYWRFIPAPVVSVSVSDGVVEYGIMPVNTSKSTLDLSDMQTATNDGNVTENFNIKGQDATGGGCTWTLASTNGSDQYVHQFCNDTDLDCSSPPTNYTSLTTGYQTLDTAIPVSGTVNFQLRLTTPTASSCFGQQSVNVTIQATQ